MASNRVTFYANNMKTDQTQDELTLGVFIMRIYDTCND